MQQCLVSSESCPLSWWALSAQFIAMGRADIGSQSRTRLSGWATGADKGRRCNLIIRAAFLNCRSERSEVKVSVVPDSLRPHGLHSPWNSPGQNTGVGSLFLLQGIFPTRGSNPGLPHRRRILHPPSRQGSPWRAEVQVKCHWKLWPAAEHLFTLLGDGVLKFCFPLFLRCLFAFAFSNAVTIYTRTPSRMEQVWCSDRLGVAKRAKLSSPTLNTTKL